MLFRPLEMNNMPLRTLPAVRRPLERTEILKRLVEEWRNPRAEGQPDIVIDENGEATRVFVIWDDWHGWNHVERSEIVTDAFVAVRGEK
jgi:hypothetical protein